MRFQKPNVEELYQGILNGNITLLSRAITMIESHKIEDQENSNNLLHKCLQHTSNSIRIGITGVPGVGKSTFIEAFGMYLLKKKYKVAVLTIDPSSSISDGSILGDKTRMQELSLQQNAYIRPSASGKNLGGVAKNTREAIILCETAGFEVIIIETVGVGQSELIAHSMVDFFLLLKLAGAGDELQGIKRGIMEMADAIVINKVDGKNIAASKIAVANFKNALHLFPPKASHWTPPVLTASALHHIGIDTVWQNILEYINLTKSNGFFIENRKNQNQKTLHQTFQNLVMQWVLSQKELEIALKKEEQDVLQLKKSPYQAALNLIKLLK
ncbi:MAG: methylmalonyl Co-A mutase-associated GTPase MeaB [Flavobacterium sp.]